MALMTPAAAGARSADAVRASLTRRDRDVPGLLLATLLLVTVSVTLLILFTLVGQVLTSALPLLSDRGGAFLTDTIGSNPTKVGIWPGIYGFRWCVRPHVAAPDKAPDLHPGRKCRADACQAVFDHKTV